LIHDKKSVMKNKSRNSKTCFCDCGRVISCWYTSWMCIIYVQYKSEMMCDIQYLADLTHMN